MHDRNHAEQLVVRIHREQLEIRSSEFLDMHLRNRTIIRRHVDAFFRYLPYVKKGNALDWGCRHAVDACLIKDRFRSEVSLFGCDVMDEGYEAFHRSATLEFSFLEHPYKLPYDSDMFDTVIGSGVLEHVPNDLESLKEIRRVLKPGGNLIITFLPNRYSYIEFLCRKMGRSHHDRLYSIRAIRSLLSRSGLVPVCCRYHQVTPTLAGGDSERLGRIRAVNALVRGLYVFNGALERLWPINGVASNIMAVASKDPSGRLYSPPP